MAHCPYQSTPARRALMGYEPTSNPNPAAAMLLKIGVKRPTLHSQGFARRLLRRRTRTSNPLPAALALSGGLSKAAAGIARSIGIKLPSPRYEGGPLVSTVQGFLDKIKAGDMAALELLHTLATSPGEKHRTQWAKVWNVELPTLGGALSAKVRAQIRALDPTTTIPASGEKSVSLASQVVGALGQPGTIRALASTARGGRRGRARYPTYTDRYGRQRYSTKPPGSEMRIPAGAVPAADTPYSFFSGAVGQGGALKTTGQLAIAAAVGTAAYFATQAILKHFSGANVPKEEAGVKLALAAREARKEYALTHNLRGPAPSYGVPASVIRDIGANMKRQLAELGYNAQGVRTRSTSERFLATYGEGE